MSHGMPLGKDQRRKEEDYLRQEVVTDPLSSAGEHGMSYFMSKLQKTNSLAPAATDDPDSL